MYEFHTNKPWYFEMQYKNAKEFVIPFTWTAEYTGSYLIDSASRDYPNSRMKASCMVWHHGLILIWVVTFYLQRRSSRGLTGIKFVSY